MGDPGYGDCNFIPALGMRVRSTQNVEKDRVCECRSDSGVVLCREVRGQENGGCFVASIQSGKKRSPHHLWLYATTMRRAQGATLDLVGLWFNRKARSWVWIRGRISSQSPCRCLPSGKRPPQRLAAGRRRPWRARSGSSWARK